MKQIGIIYKFTIIVKYKFDGHKPFYVGQHWETKSIDKFLSRNCNNYSGSGTIWGDFINKLKQEFPTCWRKLIKREVLYASEMVNQKGLDKMEEYFIKHEKAHYSYKLGGCNILWGTANKFGSGSPMKDPMIAAKCGKSVKKWNKNNPEKRRKIEEKRLYQLKNSDYKKKISETLKGRYLGKNNPNFANHWTDEQKRKQSEKMKGRYLGENNPNYGNRWTDEQKKKLKQKLKISNHSVGKNNPMFNKKRITNGIVNTIIDNDAELPIGFWYGMKKRKI